jgi:hypothetical protein
LKQVAKKPEENAKPNAGGDISLDVAEMNALRAKLGLGALK